MSKLATTQVHLLDIPPEQLIAHGFLPVTYPDQEGTYYAKTLKAKAMPGFLQRAVDNDVIFETDDIVVEVCPDNKVQLVDQNSDYYEEPVLVTSSAGRALLKDAGFEFAIEGAHA